MPLTDAYVQVYGQLGDFLDRIAKGQAPGRFTRQHLKDLGLTSASFNAMIPLMKALGFLADSGSPAVPPLPRQFPIASCDGRGAARGLWRPLRDQGESH